VDIGRLARQQPVCHRGYVNVIVVEVKAGRDGKCYPVGGDLPVADRARAIKMVHNLVHRDRLSIRAAQRIMLESYGLRRSLGILHRDLTSYACPVCEPEHPAFTGG
jgi:hypothetical protein